MLINRQTVIIGMRFGLYVLILAVNAYAIWITRSFCPIVVVLSLLLIPFFHLMLAGVWEPFRLRRIAYQRSETFIIPPHYAWDMHRDSRSDYSNVPGTLALTNRCLRFVSSPLYTDEDIVRGIPLNVIVRISDVPPDGKWGYFLTLTLRDGAKMKLKFRFGHQQARWQRELRAIIYETV